MDKKGYKAFYKDKKNRYGQTFEEGKSYHVEGPIIFGNKGNEFHFCERLEDTLRYVPAMEEEIEIAKITAHGTIVTYHDEYYGYYDMHACETIDINHFLSRQEIISKYRYSPTYQVKRFIESFRLTKEEIELFKIQYANNQEVLNAILYFQENKKDVYQESFNKKVKVKQKKER